MSWYDSYETMDPDIARLAPEILRLADRHGARQIRVFGSRARGAGRSSSDLDLLVCLDDGRTLFDLSVLRDALANLVGCPVDIVTEAGLSPYLRDSILNEAVPLDREAA